jgi:hypothetical protein
MNNLAIVFCAGFLGASCSSPKPAEIGVTNEMPAIDVDACIASPSCMGKDASAIEVFFPGNHAIHIPKGASITAPLERPSATAKLHYLVVGVAAEGDYYGIHHMKVSVSGLPDSEISPIGGFTRTELDEQSRVPAATNPTVTLTTTEGDAFDLLWVEGRWDD